MDQKRMTSLILTTSWLATTIESLVSWLEFGSVKFLLKSRIFSRKSRFSSTMSAASTSRGGVCCLCCIFRDFSIVLK